MKTKQLTIKEWLTVWAKAARAPFLVVSFLPALLGGAIAWQNGLLDWTPFLLALIGVVMAHSAADFFDDYYDFKSGNLGNKEKQFHDSPLISGEVTVKQVMFAALLCMVVALACGAWLLFREPQAVLWMTLAGAFIVFFYTAPPVRLNYRGLGELMLFFAFGPLIVLGVYWVTAGEFSWTAMIAGIAPGIFTMNVGIVSNIFDHDDDVQSGKYTMPVRFGQRNAVIVLGAGIALAYLSVALGVVFQWLPVYALAAFLTLPLTVQTVRASYQYRDLNRYTGAMTKAIAAASLISVILALAFWVEGVV
jgi:1,4-dihydroxy-2-naphthoate polyprenyltransferase